jgi:outer membrane protein OmpA-like peptidoglycan-associated protein
MAAPLAAQYRGLSAGLGGEANGVTIFDDLGVGAVFTLENRLNRYFALDFHGGASLPLSRMADLGTPDTFLGFEAQLFLRYYMLSPPEMDTPRGAELFLAAGGGLIAVMNGTDARDTRGSPEVSAILGLRIRLGKRFYLEPYARGGYPFLFGGGLAAGIRFPAKAEVKTVIVNAPPEPREPAVEPAEAVDRAEADEPVVVVDLAEAVGRAAAVEPVVVAVHEPAPPPALTRAVPRSAGVFVVRVPPDGPYFDGLSRETIEENTRILKEVAGLLKKYPSARLLIEGYANPILGTQREAANTLLPLSQQRARFIFAVLAAEGIARERLVTIGEGGVNPIVPINDRANWEKNRRVELRILW